MTREEFDSLIVRFEEQNVPKPYRLIGVSGYDKVIFNLRLFFINYIKPVLYFLFPESTIKGNIVLWLKTLGVIFNFIWGVFNATWRWIGGACIIVLSIVIWLPISMWKTGLVVSDHIMKYITNDK